MFKNWWKKKNLQKSISRIARAQDSRDQKKRCKNFLETKQAFFLFLKCVLIYSCFACQRKTKLRKNFYTYSHGHFFFVKAHFMYQTSQLHNAILLRKSTSMILPQPLCFTIDWSFKMRYCMSSYLNWHRN